MFVHAFGYQKSLVAAVASLTALLPLGSTVAAPDASASGAWAGVTQTQRTRSTAMLSAGYTARGEYWFRVDKDGIIRGYAVVTYQPTADLSGINARVGAAKDIVSSFLGAFGPGGMIPENMSVNQILGAKIDWTDPMPVLRGPITGSMDHGKVALRWDNKQPSSISATLSLSYLSGDEKLTKVGQLKFPIDTPWPGQAAAVDPQAQHLVAAGNKLGKGEVSDSASWAWTVHLEQ